MGYFEVLPLYHVKLPAPSLCPVHHPLTDTHTHSNHLENPKKLSMGNYDWVDGLEEGELANYKKHADIVAKTAGMPHKEFKSRNDLKCRLGELDTRGALTGPLESEVQLTYFRKSKKRAEGMRKTLETMLRGKRAKENGVDLKEVSLFGSIGKRVDTQYSDLDFELILNKGGKKACEAACRMVRTWAEQLGYHIVKFGETRAEPSVAWLVRFDMRCKHGSLQIDATACMQEGKTRDGPEMADAKKKDPNVVPLVRLLKLWSRVVRRHHRKTHNGGDLEEIKGTHIETIALKVCGNRDSLEEVFMKALEEFIKVVNGDKGDMDFIAPEKLPCAQYTEYAQEQIRIIRKGIRSP